MSAVVAGDKLPKMANRLWIKICGVTNPADARFAVSLGADAIGLNFYRPSPRFVGQDIARIIRKEMPTTVDAVGVFVRTPMSEMREFAVGVGGLTGLQSYGEPTVEESSPYRYIPSFPVKNRGGLERITKYIEECRQRNHLPFAILIDSYIEGRFGGSGQVAPWELLAEFNPGVPMILAGGLSTDNVADAIRIVQPFGVDVASGVEQRPGKKDWEKMRRFIGEARSLIDNDNQPLILFRR